MVAGIAYRRCDVIADLGICMYRRRVGDDRVCTSTVDSINEPLPTNYVELTPWSLVEPSSPPLQDTETRRELFGNAKLGLLYSGNLGRAHGFEQFLKLARSLNNDCSSNIAMCFAGRGQRMDELKSLVTEGDTNIRFAGFANESQLEKRLAAADLHLVSLREEWTGTVVPSKFFGALAAGRAVLFSGSPHSCIAQWIEKYKLGWVLTDQNNDQVAESLMRLAAHPAELQGLRDRCHDVYHRHFSKSVQLERWNELVL